MRIGLSQAEFAALGGLGKQAQLNYESGARSPDANYLASLTKVGVDVQYVIMGDRSDQAACPVEEVALIRCFRQLSETGKASAMATIKAVSEGGQVIPSALPQDEANILESFRQLNDIGRAALQAAASGYLYVGEMTLSGEPAKRIPRVAANRMAKLDAFVEEEVKAAEADMDRIRRERASRKRGKADQD